MASTDEQPAAGPRTVPARIAPTLIHIAGGEIWGGPESYILDICRHFRSRKWKVRVLTRDIKEIDSRFAQAGISVRHAPLRRYPDIFSALIIRSMLRSVARGKGIIHVHTHHDALTAILARRLARRPDIRIVFTRHKGLRGKDSRIRRYIYSRVDRLLFVSEFSRRRFLAAWPDGRYPFRTEDTMVCYNSVLLPEDHEVAPEPERGPIVAMYLGVVKAGKGLEVLIDAMSLLKNVKVRLRIAGNGDPDYMDALRRRAQSRGVMDKIDWTRKIDNPLQLISESHFGVFPSIDPEAFGFNNLEFMACGRPQISTLTGGQAEFLTPLSDTLVVRPTDAASLADAIRQLAADPVMRRDMGLAARAAFEAKFSWSNFINRLQDAYAF
ncbi:MAG: glycosyltransferase family 4 protein [Muribaculum sp.]|nr:glycosyltransferase family 4 protein [Muribaculum sp.]